MKSISKSRHEHLRASIEELELLLQESRIVDSPSIYSDLVQGKEQMELLFKQYEMLLAQVAKVVQDYSSLSAHVKGELLGKHLKNMQKIMKPEDPMYQHLHLAVHFLYSA
jgi:hypothetical protein